MQKGSYKAGSLRYYANKYNTSYETINRIKNEGLDLEDESLITARLNKVSDIKYSFIPSENQEEGLRAAIKRLRDSEVKAYSQYISDLENNPGQAGISLKNWSNILTQLTKVEAENPDIETANNDVIIKAELSSVLNETFSNLRLDLDSLPRRFANLTEGKDKIQRERIAEKEVNKIINCLFSCKYLNE